MCHDKAWHVTTWLGSSLEAFSSLAPFQLRGMILQVPV